MKWFAAIDLGNRRAAEAKVHMNFIRDDLMCLQNVRGEMLSPEELDALLNQSQPMRLAVIGLKENRWLTLHSD